MKKIFALALSLWTPFAFAGPLVSLLSASQVGISAANLSDSPTTAAIAMDGDSTGNYNTLALTVTGTPGTTTAVTVACKQSTTSAGTYVPINACTGSSCVADSRVYAYPSGGFTSTWRVPYRWAKCTFSGSGNGTLSVAVQRSKQ